MSGIIQILFWILFHFETFPHFFQFLFLSYTASHLYISLRTSDKSTSCAVRPLIDLHNSVLSWMSIASRFLGRTSGCKWAVWRTPTRNQPKMCFVFSAPIQQMVSQSSKFSKIGPNMGPMVMFLKVYMIPTCHMHQKLVVANSSEVNDYRESSVVVFFWFFFATNFASSE